MLKKIIFILFTAFLLTDIYGCVGYGRAYVQPLPPPAEVEVIGVAPFEGAIWAPGYWQWHRRHREYHWVRGSWRGPEHWHR